MSDSDDDPGPPPPALTKAEKAKATRAANLRRQQMEDDKITAETTGVRESKAKAYKKHVWSKKRAGADDDVVEEPEVKKPKLASSGAQGKKAQVKASSALPQKPPATKPGAAASTSRKHVKQASDEDGSARPTTTRARARPHAAAVIQDSDSDTEALRRRFHKPKPEPPPSPPSVPKVKPRAKRTVTEDDEGSGMSEPDAGARSPEEDPEEDPLVLEAQFLAELPQILAPRLPVGDTDHSNGGEDDLHDDVDMPDAPRRRAGSFSSEYDLPATTDIDESDHMYHPESMDDDESEEEPTREAPRKKSAQQAKYDLEQPTVKPRPIPAKKTSSKRVKVKTEKTDAPLPPSDDDGDQSRWGPAAHIVYPKRGEIRLTDQNEQLQGVIKDAMELLLVDTSFVNPYPEMVVSRGKFVQKYLYQAARERGATDIKSRTRYDDSFCQALADLICARTGIFRNTVKKLAHAKVPIYYQLTSDGVSSTEVRARVKLALQNEQYIFPIAWRIPKPVDGALTQKQRPELRFQNSRLVLERIPTTSLEDQSTMRSRGPTISILVIPSRYVILLLLSLRPERSLRVACIISQSLNPSRWTS
ncbi:hypothetical protein C8R46DRAFT_1210740 [Mycena filopes]|nr:hypothetical protein C8R46DRAFT_1210740 [Mycena filopes]